MQICLRLSFERTYLKEIWSVLHVAKKFAHNTADAGSGRQNMNSKTHCGKLTGETKTSRAEEKQIAEEHAPSGEDTTKGNLLKYILYVSPERKKQRKCS